MGDVWEIRGVFGNEYALEQAVEELKKHKGFEWVVLDRRNISVRFPKREKEAEEVVKRAFEIAHGYVEYEAKMGEYDRIKSEEKRKKLEKEEKKRKKQAKH
ncbi:MAG: hypothetical protein HY297_00880 [Thaumarchaeota archaeon]|nr:hypothetical protein [Nitrososphaerota archaeon]